MTDARVRLLRTNPPFRWLWIGRTVSAIGDGVSYIALILFVQGTQRTGVAVGGLILAQGLPRLLGPFAGTLADRIDQRSLMIVGNAGQGLLYGVIAATLPSYPVLIALVAAASLLQTAVTPAGGSAVPTLVAPHELLSANAWIGMSLNIRVAIAPVIGGALVATVGARGALWIDAATFLVLCLALLRLPRLRPVPDAAEQGFLRTTWSGLAFAARDPVLRALTLGLFLGVALAGMDNVALPFLARGPLHLDAVGFGLLGSAYGVGMVAASLGLLRAGARAHPGRWLLIGWLASGAGFLLCGFPIPFAAVAAGQLVAGAGNGLTNITEDTIVQSHAPVAMMGRAFGVLSSAAFVGGAVASIVGGVLLDATSARTTFLVAGAGTLAVLVLQWAMLPRAVRSPRVADDASG